MKCEHCGKNDVQFVYRSNINGKVEEAHLCAECAEKLGYAKKLSMQRSSLMDEFLNPERFFGDSFFGDFFSPLPSLLGRGFFQDPFTALLQEENPTAVSETKPAEDASAQAAAPAQEAAPQQESAPAKTGEESRFARMRRLNALRLEMKRAVRAEEFERAAEIRDEIRTLEAEHGGNA